MDITEKALSFFDHGYNCAQAVYAAFAGKYGFDEKQALLAAASFGGGMGRLGKTCGALNGALMVLGHIYGEGLNSNPDIKDKLYEKTRKVFGEFERMNGSSVCNELTGYNMIDPVQRKKAHDEGVFKSKCPQLVKNAVIIINGIDENL